MYNAKNKLNIKIIISAAYDYFRKQNRSHLMSRFFQESVLLQVNKLYKFRLLI